MTDHSEEINQIKQFLAECAIIAGKDFEELSKIYSFETAWEAEMSPEAAVDDSRACMNS